jgi:hypothetical protein
VKCFGFFASLLGVRKTRRFGWGDAVSRGDCA